MKIIFSICFSLWSLTTFAQEVQKPLSEVEAKERIQKRLEKIIRAPKDEKPVELENLKTEIQGLMSSVINQQKSNSANGDASKPQSTSQASRNQGDRQNDQYQQGRLNNSGKKGTSIAANGKDTAPATIYEAVNEVDVNNRFGEARLQKLVMEFVEQLEKD